MDTSMSVSDRALPSPADAVEPRLSKILVAPVRAIAFWMAIVLPVVYLPLLATGLDSLRPALTFATLVAVHVCALVAGQSHGRRR
jgi:hypothetical protein